MSRFLSLYKIKFYRHKKPFKNKGLIKLYGGERGIRTLETLLTLTHFPGVLLQPLGHLTVNYCNSSLRCRQTVILPSQTFQAKPPLKLACRADLSAGNCTQIDL